MVGSIDQRALEQFGTELRIASEQLSEVHVRELVTETAARMIQILVLGTPVDTGRARANWQLELLEPLTEVPFPDPPAGREPGSAPLESAQTALDRALSNLGRIDAAPSPYIAVYVTNNVAYIDPLNQGHSAQAAPGWIDSGIELARAFMEQKAQQLGAKPFGGS